MLLFFTKCFLMNEARSRLLSRKLRWTVKAKRKFFQTEINPNLKEIKYDAKDLNEKKFVKFEDMILKRRNQAERSIIVQVHSEQSCPELYNFCLKYAPVVNMFHYSHNKNHFVLVEFSENVVENVLPKCSHSTKPLNGEVKVPVTSPVLWFKAASSKEKKLIAPNPSEIPLQNTSPPFTWPALLDLISSAPSISEGMKILYEATKLDELGVRLRFLTARQLELSLNGLFPNCAAIPFGSSLNSFGKLGCDLDLVFQHRYILPFLKTDETESRLVYQCKINSGGTRVHTQRQMEVLADIIHVYLPGCAGIKRILQARVPIVKYTNEITGLDCDVSMSNLTGVYMSEILYLLASIEPLSRELVFTVKRWAKDIGLTNATPGRWITNFTLTLLCLFYMQVKSILPPLNTLRSQSLKEDSRTTEDIDCTFCRDLSRFDWESKGENYDSGKLLKGFFEYYTQFDFSTLGVSLNSGGPFVKPDYSPMYVANPLEKGLNVAKNMSAEEVERLRIAMRNASWDLENNETLLCLISKDNPYKKEKKYIPNRMVAVKDLFER